MRQIVAIVLALFVVFGFTFVSEVRSLDQSSTINQMISSVSPAVYCFDCRLQISICNNLQLQKEIAEARCNVYRDIYGWNNDTTISACEEYDRLFFLAGQCWNSVDLNCNYPDI